MAMKVPTAVKMGWEHRFPGLTEKWTHWKIAGDDALLGVVDGARLMDALDLIEKHYGQFLSIQSCSTKLLAQQWVKTQN